MRLETNLLTYLPAWYREILDYQQLCLTESERFKALAREMNAVADNFFFQTMDESAVAVWERVFGIVPNPTLESLGFRRERLLNRISSRAPYTLAFLYQKLDELIGPGKWSVTVDYPNYTLYIEASSGEQSYAQEVAFTIGQIKPAHIVYVNVPYLVTGVGVSETITTGETIYHYRLGQWELGLLPFAEEGKTTMIKPRETASVTGLLLANAAQDIAARAAAARINGKVVVTELTKAVSGATAVIRYPVPPEAGTTVTQLELLDADGSPLTSATVYVPVESNLQVKHSIPVTEVT